MQRCNYLGCESIQNACQYFLQAHALLHKKSKAAKSSDIVFNAADGFFGVIRQKLHNQAAGSLNSIFAQMRPDNNKLAGLIRSDQISIDVLPDLARLQLHRGHLRHAKSMVDSHMKIALVADCTPNIKIPQGV